jgi:hypothetical protein
MRYKIPDQGWVKALKTVVETAQDGDTVVVSSEDMKVLGEMSLANRFPGKAVTFEVAVPAAPK